MTAPWLRWIERRLALKVGVIIILIEVVVLGGIGAWYISRYAARIDEQLAAQIRLPGSLMQQGVLRFSAVRDPAALGRLIGQDIELALIIKEDGLIFESAEPQLLGRPALAAVSGFEFSLDVGDDEAHLARGRHDQPDQPYVAQLTALYHEARRIGWLYLRVRTAAAESGKRELAWRYAAMTAASIALSSLVQILLLRLLLNRRIRSTESALEQARHGHLEARIPGPFSDDEIGQVQQGVNALLAETERRTAALAASEANYRLLVENQSDMVVKCDLDGRFHYASPSFCRTFGVEATTLIGSRFAPAIHDDDRISTAQAMAALLRPPYTAFIEHRARTAQGWRWFAWQHTLLRHDDGRPQAILGVGRDVTRQVELQAQLRQAQKMDAIGQLAGGVAHDFNNLLTGMLGGCQMLERSLPPDAPQLRHVALIRASASSAADLTGRLLAFARKAPQQRSVIELGEVVRSAVELVRHSVDRRLTLDLTPGAPLRVRGDAGAIQHAVINLVLNARDAMPAGGQVRISVAAIEPGHGEPELPDVALGEICVIDDGPGIPPEILPRIFEPFFTTKAVGKGTGLGLAAVYATMREHEGTVQVESQPGCTAFRLLLPLTTEQPAAKPYGATPAAGGRGIVLVVEDEPVLRQLAGEVLGNLGYRVLLAENGEIAQQHVAARPGRINCVLLDLVMPVLSGPDCFRRLRELDPTLPIVLCSGYDREAAADGLLALGANGFVRKPYDFAELAAAIAAAARVC